MELNVKNIVIAIMREKEGDSNEKYMYCICIVRKVDNPCRVVLPIELRRSLMIDVKDPFEIYVEGDTIILGQDRIYKGQIYTCRT